MTYSRSGRRGIWAGYHLYLEPGGYSILACGLWQPDKVVLQRLRDRVQARSPGPGPLRAAIGAGPFVDLFGQAEPHPLKRRQNVFGHSDELKVAPKGVPKDHPDIDLLKLRSIAVVKQYVVDEYCKRNGQADASFSDAEVLSPNFAEIVQIVVSVMAPFVHTLNDYIAPP